MGLLGVGRLDQLDPSFVREARALPSASPLLAAFPQLGGDWPTAPAA